MKKVSYSVARIIPIHTPIVGKLNKKLRDISSDKNEEIYRLRRALERIAKYQTPDQLRQSTGDDYGLDCEEALEMAYENIQEEARRWHSPMCPPKLQSVGVAPPPPLLPNQT